MPVRTDIKKIPKLLSKKINRTFIITAMQRINEFKNKEITSNSHYQITSLEKKKQSHMDVKKSERNYTKGKRIELLLI